MSHRPKPTISRPWGSTHANGARTVDARVARAKKFNLSPYPLTSVRTKHLVKQGFPNTVGNKG